MDKNKIQKQRDKEYAEWLKSLRDKDPEVYRILSEPLGVSLFNYPLSFTDPDTPYKVADKAKNLLEYDDIIGDEFWDRHNNFNYYYSYYKNYRRSRPKLEPRFYTKFDLTQYNKRRKEK